MSDPKSESEQALPSPSGSLSLPDGRILAWDEHGKSDGPAVFWFHGTPMCRLVWPGNIEAAERLGVRLISPDRPGCGSSSFDPKRRIVDWVADVAAIADELGIDRFYVIGSSGGGPYALACAASMSDRVVETYVIAGIGPQDTPELRSRLNDINRHWFELASTGPSGAMEFIESLLDPTALFDNGRSAAVEFASALPAPELEAMMADPSLAAGMQVGASGTAGLAFELWLLTQPWGIDLSSISVPVHFAIGELDISVPLSNLEFQHQAVPGSTLTVLPGEGHVAASTWIPEILAQIVNRIE